MQGANVKRVLVVDDERDVRTALHMMLELQGAVVTEAESASQCLALFAPDAFDCIITDYNMPNMRGDALAKVIKTKSRGQRIVMLSGFPEELMENGKLPWFVDAMLLKPPTAEDLTKALTPAATAAANPGPAPAAAADSRPAPMKPAARPSSPAPGSRPAVTPKPSGASGLQLQLDALRRSPEDLNQWSLTFKAMRTEVFNLIALIGGRAHLGQMKPSTSQKDELARPLVEQTDGLWKSFLTFNDCVLELLRGKPGQEPAQVAASLGPEKVTVILEALKHLRHDLSNEVSVIMARAQLVTVKAAVDEKNASFQIICEHCSRVPSLFEKFGQALNEVLPKPPPGSGSPSGPRFGRP